jgi:dGTPase
MPERKRPAKTSTKKAAHNELWSRLLSDERLYGQSFPPTENSRSEYQRDYDRVVFSSAFRRLQDKTQVFPLSQSDYTRTRLTHSLEVSSVARTLGVLAAKFLVKQGVKCEPHDVGTITATAALAHDLGNPPFGHSGESAIQAWAQRALPPTQQGRSGVVPLRVRRSDASSVRMRREELADFHSFEGNAQGFRILVRTAVRTRTGGLRPTVATLGAMFKYPRPSFVPGHTFDPTDVAAKKPGYFQDDRKMALKAFQRLGLREKAPGVFARHPLAFLTEAADDVCYAIADIEDAYKLGILEFQKVHEVLLPLASSDAGFSEMTHLSHPARLARIRASALAVLVSACITAFRENLDEMEAGLMLVPLLERTKVFEEFKAVKALAKRYVYRNERVVQIEYAGYQTIGGLLDMFYSALCGANDSPKDEKLRLLLPTDFLYRKGFSRRIAKEEKDPIVAYLEVMTPYERLLAVTDYVSGMTDRFAIQLYQRLSGIRLPE